MFKSFNLRRKGLERILGELEAAVLEEVWLRGDSSVREIHTALQPRGLAYTTVMTVMGRLAEKGLLLKETKDNAHVYKAAVSRKELEKTMVDQVSDSLQDLAIPALMRFVDHLPSDPDVLNELEQLIAQKRAELGKLGPSPLQDSL